MSDLLDGLSDDELFALLQELPDEDLVKVLEGLPVGQGDHLGMMADDYISSMKREQAQKSFMPFVNVMWPSFIAGRHHAIMARAFERVASGKCKRLIINMPPRHTKSEFASYLLPAWFLGKYPGKKVIQTSHTAELAVGFGRKVRNLVDSEKYHEIFPDVALGCQQCV
jgi:hypothetical protein